MRKLPFSLMVCILLAKVCFAYIDIDSTQSVSGGGLSTSTLLLIIFGSLVVLAIIIIALYKVLHKPKNIIEIPRDWKNPNVKHDFDDVFKGVSGEARILYKELITKCHPDRFIGDYEKIKIATDLSSKISRHKNSHSKLLQLKEEAKEKLGLSFEDLKDKEN